MGDNKSGDIKRFPSKIPARRASANITNPTPEQFKRFFKMDDSRKKNKRERSYANNGQSLKMENTSKNTPT